MILVVALSVASAYAHLDMGVQLAVRAVPERVALQLAMQLRQHRVALRAVALVEALVGMQSGGTRCEVAGSSWLVLRHIPCRQTPSLSSLQHACHGCAAAQHVVC